MSHKRLLIVAALIGFFVFSIPALRLLTRNLGRFSLVPLPRAITPRHGAFLLQAQTAILADPASRETAEYLAQTLRLSTGYPLATRVQEHAAAEQGTILLTTNNPDANPGPESYQLSINRDGVVIRASAPAGLFYGAQSLLQLLPPDVFSHEPVTRRAWAIPCVEIQDSPRFAWRGFMLDVSRHFFNKSEVEHLLDAMALHKLNVFHWHLTDDQGWRIEIKKYPRLTEIGAWRKKIGFGLDPHASSAYGPDGRYGGFYTQDDIREVVAYAQARHITIVPEIEMPGHSVAALAAYPQYSCTGGPYYTDPVMGSSAGIYCPGNEQTFAFLQDVLGEVCDLFPGKYIHIGGDEVTKPNWRDCRRCQALMHREGMKNEEQLQSYFVHRVAKNLESLGRHAVGWSEIRAGGLPTGAVLMDWTGGAVEAATAGHDVVMCPNSYCYFDYYQSRNRAAEPPASGAYLPLDKVYSFEPIPSNLGPRYGPCILGAQANLWTEYIPSLKEAEFMTFPRLCAMSEIDWSPAVRRDWDDFSRRLQAQLTRFDKIGIAYRRP